MQATQLKRAQEFAAESRDHAGTDLMLQGRFAECGRLLDTWDIDNLNDAVAERDYDKLEQWAESAVQALDTRSAMIDGADVDQLLDYALPLYRDPDCGAEALECMFDKLLARSDVREAFRDYILDGLEDPSCGGDKMTLALIELAASEVRREGSWEMISNVQALMGFAGRSFIQAGLCAYIRNEDRDYLAGDPAESRVSGAYALLDADNQESMDLLRAEMQYISRQLQAEDIERDELPPPALCAVVGRKIAEALSDQTPSEFLSEALIEIAALEVYAAAGRGLFPDVQFLCEYARTEAVQSALREAIRDELDHSNADAYAEERITGVYAMLDARDPESLALLRDTMQRLREQLESNGGRLHEMPSPALCAVVGQQVAAVLNLDAPVGSKVRLTGQLKFAPTEGVSMEVVCFREALASVAGWSGCAEYEQARRAVRLSGSVSRIIDDGDTFYPHDADANEAGIDFTAPFTRIDVFKPDAGRFVTSFFQGPAVGVQVVESGEENAVKA